MNLPSFTPAALTGAALVAAGALAGCTAEVSPAQAAAPLAVQGTARVVHEIDHGIAALTQRINWARMETAPEVQGF